MVNSKGIRKSFETSDLVHKTHHLLTVTQWGEQNKPRSEIKRVKIIDFI